MTKKKLQPSPIDDFFITRREGKVVPITVMTLLAGRVIRMTPATYGESLTLKNRNIPPDLWPPEDQCDMIRRFVTEPDFSHMTNQEMMDSMDAQTIEDLVMTVSTFSGVNRERLLKEQAELLAKAQKKEDDQKKEKAKKLGPRRARASKGKSTKS